MKKYLKIAAIVILAALVIIQFIPVNYPENVSPNPGDIIENGVATAEIGAILKTSCYDCHSNQVVYPWYSKVAPVSWLLKKDIMEGKEELNFSEWTTYNKRRMLKKLDEVKEMVEEDEMPLGIYTFIHGDAKLSETQKQQLIEWVDATTASVME